MKDLINEQENLLVCLELLRQKRFRFREALIIEADIASKFKLEKTLENLEKEEKEINQQLYRIEKSIEDFNLKQDLEVLSKNEVLVNDVVFEIIGFDLGHGETAISRTTSNSSSEPQKLDILNGEASILTTISLDPERGILIGDDAYCHRESQNLEVFFKSPYLYDKKTSEAIKLFVYKCLKLLKESNKITDNKNTYFYFGCPSGWTAEDRKAYRHILAQAGVRNIVIIPESRAAFLEAKESGILNKSDGTLFDSALIIDIGSSTTDFTIVKNYKEKPLDFGYVVLGSGLIDVAILDKAIENQSDEKNDFINIFEKNPEIKTKCLLKCRYVKEKYFSKVNDLDWFETPCSESEKIGSKKYFDIDIYKSDMDAILSTRIPELDNLSWPEYFHKSLVLCKESLNGQDPELILLTGGGSRMKFTQSICQEVFPGSIFRVGLEPHLVVSRGLAIAGRTDIRVKAFRQEIEELIASDKLINVIQKEFPELYKCIAKNLFETCKKISISCSKRWVEGELKTLSDMESELTSKINLFVEEEAESIFVQSTMFWVNKLVPKIDLLTFDICEKYDIPSKSMTVSISPSSIDLDGSEFKGVVKPGSSMTSAAGNVVGWATGITSGGALMIAALFLTTGIAGILSSIIFWALYPVVITAGVATGMISRESLKGAADKKIKNTNIPLWLRGSLLPEDRMDEAMEEKRREIEKKLVSALEDEFISRNQKDEIITSVRESLNERADEACILIR